MSALSNLQLQIFRAYFMSDLNIYIYICVYKCVILCQLSYLVYQKMSFNYIMCDIHVYCTRWLQAHVYRMYRMLKWCMVSIMCMYNYACIVSTYLSARLSVYLFICLSVCLSVYLSVCLSASLSLCLSIFLSFCLPTYRSIHPSIDLSICNSSVAYTFVHEHNNMDGQFMMTSKRDQL